MLKIIIAEDDPMIAEIYQRKFSQSGFEVRMADSGKRVLALTKEEKPDLILLDLMMPKISGFEVIEKLKSGGYDPNIKIIVSSNLSQRENREKALKLGADGFVVKSEYTPSDLVKEVQRLMGQMREEKKNGARINGNSNGQNPAENKNGSKKILMIEDEDVFIEMFGDKLRRDGYQVEVEKNGVAAIKKALENGFDLFIIDAITNTISGEEMIDRLRLEEKTKNTPVIVLSASEESQVKQEFEKRGVADFLMKTQIIPSDLSKKVANILGNQN